MEWTGTTTLGEGWNNRSRAQVTKWNDFYGRSTRIFSFIRTGEWNIEGSLRARSADIPSAIKYLEKMWEQSSDPALRKNADSSIHALKHLSPGCQVPNPC